MKKCLLLASAFLSIVSCQKSDNDLLQEAQSCLNKSPANQARSCVEKISSLSTPSASKLKCSALYISEGFSSAAVLIKALDQINKSSSSIGCSNSNCSPTLAVMNEFNFSSGDNTNSANRDRNIATANEAVNLCGASESKAYIQISSLFKLGTLATMNAFSLGLGLTNGQTPTIAQLQTSVQSLPASEIGKLVINTYSSTCINIQNASAATQNYCQELSNAIGSNSNNYSAVGSCLLNKLNDSNSTCP